MEIPTEAPIPEQFDLGYWEDRYREQKAEELRIWKEEVRPEFWRWVPNKRLAFTAEQLREMAVLVGEVDRARMLEIMATGQGVSNETLAGMFRVPVDLVRYYRKELKRATKRQAIEGKGNTDERIRVLLDQMLGEMERRMHRSEYKGELELGELVKAAQGLALMAQRVQSGDLGVGKGEDQTVRVISRMPKKKDVEEEDGEPLEEPLSHRLH